MRIHTFVTKPQHIPFHQSSSPPGPHAPTVRITVRLKLNTPLALTFSLPHELLSHLQPSPHPLPLHCFSAHRKGRLVSPPHKCACQFSSQLRRRRRSACVIVVQSFCTVTNRPNHNNSHSDLCNFGCCRWTVSTSKVVCTCHLRIHSNS